MKFPAYGAQITAYTVAGLSHRTGGRVDFEGIWARQAISPRLEELIGEWAPKVNELLRSSAGQKNPSEWFKKIECWHDINTQLPDLADPLPSELSYGSGGAGTGGSVVARHSVADYERIERCMQISSPTWMEVAERGQKAGLIHWRVAGICRTLAQYAAGGWDRKPSVKQAKPALEAVLTVANSGLVNIDAVAKLVESDES